MSSFIDRIKHAVTVEDDTPATPASPTPPVQRPMGQSTVAAAAQAVSSPAPSIASSFATAPTVAVDETVYKRILDKTDFETTDTAAVIHKYLDPLASLPLDTNTKFKTAVAQAKSLDGLTEDKILATYDGLKNALLHEIETFQRAADDFVAKEVTARQDQLAQIQQQIVELQQKQQQLGAEYADAQARASSAQAQFNLASQRRAAEIDSEKIRTAAMLH